MALTREQLENAIRHYAAQGDHASVLRLNETLKSVGQGAGAAAPGVPTVSRDTAPADVPVPPAPISDVPTPPPANAVAPAAIAEPETDVGRSVVEGLNDLTASLVGLPGEALNAVVNAPGALATVGTDVLQFLGWPIADRPFTAIDTPGTISDVRRGIADISGEQMRDPIRDMTGTERAIRLGTSAAVPFAVPWMAAARAPTVVGSSAPIRGTPAAAVPGARTPVTAADVLTEGQHAAALREGPGAVARVAAADAGELAGFTAAAETANQFGIENPVVTVPLELAGAVAGRGAGARGARVVAPVPRTDVPVVRDTAGQAIPEDITEAGAALLQERVEQGGRGASEVAEEIRSNLSELEALGARERPTAGALTDSTGVLVQDARTRRAAQEEALAVDEAVQQDAARAVNELAPAGPTAVEPGAAAQEILARREAQAPVASGRVAAEADVTAAEQAREGGALASAQPGDVRQDIADTVRTTRDTARDTRDQLYAAIDPDPQNAPRVVQVTSTASPTGPQQAGAVVLGRQTPGTFPLEDAAAAVRAARSRLSGPSLQQWERIIKDVEDLSPAAAPPGTAPGAGQTGFASLSDLQALRKRLNARIDTALRSPDPEVSGDLADALIQTRTAINRIYDDLDVGPAAGSVNAPTTAQAAARESATAAETARTFMRDQFGPAFKEGVSGDIARRDRTRSPVPEEDIAGKFLKPGAGGATRAAQLRQINSMAANPTEANRLVEQYLVDDLARTFQSKNMSPQALRTWRAKYGDTLGEFPDAQQRVDQLIQDANALDLDVTTAQQRLRGASEAEKTLLRELRDDPLNIIRGADRERAVRAVMSSNHPERSMREITEKLRDNPDALQSWRSDVQNYIRDQISTATVAGDGLQAPSFAKVDRLMRRHEPTLRALYGDEGVAVLNRVRTVMRNQARLSRQVEPGSATAARDITREERQMAALTLLVRIKFGILKGGGIMRTIREANKSIGRGRSESEMIDDVLNRAMLDPELAAKLLDTQIRTGRKPDVKPLVSIFNEVLSESEVAPEEGPSLFGEPEEEPLFVG